MSTDKSDLKIGDWVLDISPEGTGVPVKIATEGQLHQAREDSSYVKLTEEEAESISSQL